MRLDLRAILGAGFCLLLIAQVPVSVDPKFIDPPMHESSEPIDPLTTDPAAIKHQDTLVAHDPLAKPPALEDVIGINWAQMQTCVSNTDCVLINDFVGCCHERPVNMRYAELVEENRDLLHQKFTPAADITPCLVAKCVPPRRVSGCRNGLCEAVFLPSRLQKVEALNIAALALDRKLHTGDFGTPIFGYDPDKMVWMVDFGPIKGLHKMAIKEKGIDTGYRVILDDATEKAEITTYEIKQDVLP